VASAPKDTVSPDTKRTTSYSKFSREGRVDVLQAKKHLESARRDFKTIGAYSREKDVMYLMARLCHELGSFQERNQISAEFKKLEEQQPTHSLSILATML
jgi:hypothetical protein